MEMKASARNCLGVKMSPNNGSNPLGEQLIMDESASDTSLLPSSADADTSEEIKIAVDKRSTTSKLKKTEENKNAVTNNQDNVVPEGVLFPCCQEYKDPNKKYDHLRSHHNHLKEEDNKICQFCYRKLSSKSSLDRHLLPHAGLKPYKCGECNKLFSTNGNMHRHMKIHKGKFKNKNNTFDKNAIPKKVKRSLASKQGATELKCKPECTEEDEIYVSHDRRRKNKEKKDDENSEINLRSKRLKSDISNDEIIINEKQITTINKDSDINEKIESTATKEKYKNGRSGKKDKPRSDLSHTQGSHLLPHFPTPVQGFSDIDTYYVNYTDFASSKFPLVAKSICENTDREISFPEHCYQCMVCNKAFPIKAALQLHYKEHEEKNINSVDGYTLNLNQKDEFLCNFGLMRASHADKKNGLIPNKNNLIVESMMPNVSFHELQDFSNCPRNVMTHYLNNINENNMNIEDSQKDIHDCDGNPLNDELQSNSVDNHQFATGSKHKDSPKFQLLCKVASKFNQLKFEKDSDVDHISLSPVFLENDLERNNLQNEFEMQSEAQVQKQVDICTVCKKEFKNKIALDRHTHKCRIETTFNCTLCEENLTCKSEAIEHIIKVHCIEEETAERLIKSNINKESGTVIKYVCEYCKKEFESSISMENHKRASLGSCPAKPYKCIKCDRTFVSKNNGKRHQANYHKENQDENCIVKNEWIKNKKHIKCSEKSNEVSIGCNDSNSHLVKVDAHRDKHSVHRDKEVLDVAESLVYMSNQACPNVQTPDFPSFENKFHKHINSQSDMYTNNTSCMIPQCEADGEEEALNLSLRAIDLTTSQKSSSKTQDLNLTTKSITYDNSIQNKIENSKTYSLPWLNLTHKRKENSRSPTNSSSYPVSTKASFVKPNKQTTCNNSSYDFPQGNIKYKCTYCLMKFANNSNKRRHEKNIHFCRDVSHSVNTNHVTVNSRNDSEKNKSVLSKETKAALISKVGYGKITCSMPKTNLIESLTEAVSIEVENLDLASVSSLINTANTPSLKQYLTTDNSEVVNSERLCTSSNDFDSKSFLDGNEEANNNGRNSYKYCSVCHKEFKNKSALKRHSVTHTKEKLYKCEVCKSDFTTKSNRDRHINKKHTKSVLQKALNKKSTIAELNNKVDLKDVPSTNGTCITQHLQSNKENQRLNVVNVQDFQSI